MFFGLSISLIACAAKAPQKSQLEIREFQTRSYPVKDMKVALKAVLNTLQDDGFIVKEANTELGFLTATKEMDVENSGPAFFGSMFGGRDARWDKITILEATANCTSFNKETRVRINFQKKTLDNKGGVVTVKPIEESMFYQEFFAKVDKGMFIEKEKL